MKHVKNINELYISQFNSFEKLSGQFQGKYSMRLNKQYRLILFFTDVGEMTIAQIEKISKHYE